MPAGERKVLVFKITNTTFEKLKERIPRLDGKLLKMGSFDDGSDYCILVVDPDLPTKEFLEIKRYVDEAGGKLTEFEVSMVVD